MKPKPTFVLAALIISACSSSGEKITGKITDPIAKPSVDTCAVARPDFGGPATAADRALFAYDVKAPLNLKKTVDSISNGVEFNSISYDSPDGGPVPGIMYVPVGRPGPLAGAVVMHGSFGPTAPAKGARLSQFEMAALAQRGAVVIGIDAPYVRRGAFVTVSVTSLDRLEQIQLMKELQRAVDVLLAQGNVDPARIGFSGYSYGGMVGVHFAGIERRLKAAVIAAGYGGTVTIATTAGNLQQLSTNSCALRNDWFRENTPIEPIRFIPGASPTVLLFQIARFDMNVPPADAQAAYDAASSPKEVLYYDTGHGLNTQAFADRVTWLAKQLGMDPPAQ
jgi:uncharacterized protein